MLPNNILKCMAPEDRKPLGKAGLTSEEALLREAFDRESKLQKLINNFLLLRGIHGVWASTHKKTTTKKGTPDFLFAFRGVPVALEVKMEGRHLEPEQEAMRQKLTDRTNGWRHYLVTSVEQVKRIIDLIESESNLKNMTMDQKTE